MCNVFKKGAGTYKKGIFARSYISYTDERGILLMKALILDNDRIHEAWKIALRTFVGIMSTPCVQEISRNKHFCTRL